MTKFKVMLYSSQIKEIGRMIEVEVEEERPTVLSVLQKMAQTFGQHIWDYLVSVNGQEVKDSEKLKTEVSPGDIIVIFLPISGG